MSYKPVDRMLLDRALASDVILAFLSMGVCPYGFYREDLKAFAHRLATPPTESKEAPNGIQRMIDAAKRDVNELPAWLKHGETPSRIMSEWQPIETLSANDHERELWFWCVAKTREEAFINTSGGSIFSTHRPFMHRGKFNTWCSLSKATHWMPLPDPPKVQGETT